jgi:broad specificity phosphatase PhoE
MTIMTEHQIPIYFIRHAQSKFNAVYDALKPDPMIFDAELSELGHSQATRTGQIINKLNITKVIVSPFTRTLQTASLIFGEQRNFEINALVREQLCNSCDIGTHPEMLGELYSHLDFSHLDDCWWYQGEMDHRGFATEPHDVLSERADNFTNRLRGDKSLLHDNHAAGEEIKPDPSIAIVSHGNFIRAVTGVQPANCEIVNFNPFSGVARSIDIGL